MHRIVNDEALDTLFRAARSHYAWLPRPVSDTMLRALWELVKLGPRSADATPADLVFVRSPEAKAKLAAAVSGEQRSAVATAPVVAIVGCRAGAGPREAALDAACLIIAARALGLDCGPIWQFDDGLVDGAFFPDRTPGAQFLIAFGYGDKTQLASSEARAGLDEACRIL